MRRVILLVLDGCGAGSAPDFKAFGETEPANTLRNVWERNGGLNCPHLASLGFFAPAGIPLTQPLRPHAHTETLVPASRGGKDSVTGHWEMMGIVLDEPFPTYPHGFPEELVGEFSRRIGRGVLGNRAASGTAIIAELGEGHVRSGDPILYTSADSVFQVAAHEAVVPVPQLYEWCEIARDLCQAPHNVQRIIARPFTGEAGEYQRTENRRDWPLPPPRNLVDEIGDVFGIGVVPELFSHRGFRNVPRTQSNPAHAVMLREALRSDARFIFANFEDFDMKHGHRNDPTGFGRCLEEFDVNLAEILNAIQPHDVLLITADHGNDPTTASTDHSREVVPLSVYNPSGTTNLTKDAENSPGFGRIADLIAHYLLQR